MTAEIGVDNSVTVATFTYDSDGRRVKAIVDGETILFTSTHFEVNTITSEVSKYYMDK